jgi:hypothetical protein
MLLVFGCPVFEWLMWCYDIGGNDIGGFLATLEVCDIGGDDIGGDDIGG